MNLIYLACCFVFFFSDIEKAFDTIEWSLKKALECREYSLDTKFASQLKCSLKKGLVIFFDTDWDFCSPISISNLPLCKTILHSFLLMDQQLHKVKHFCLT